MNICVLKSYLIWKRMILVPTKRVKCFKKCLYNTGNGNCVLLPSKTLYHAPDDIVEHCINEITKISDLSTEGISKLPKPSPRQKTKQPHFYFEILLNNGDTIYVSSTIHYKTQNVCRIFGLEGKGKCLREVTKEEYDKYHN